MHKADWAHIKELFHQTLGLTAEERATFLGDESETVRREVAELIASHESAEDFIARSAADEYGLNTNALIGKQIGNYTLLEVVGTGGMGTVFRASRDGFEKEFAVKLIKRGMDTDAVLRRFQLERRILSRLEHPNIAGLIDGGTTDEGLPYFVLEYIDGVPVTRFCTDRQLDTRRRLELFRRICSAASYAHQNLVVHRDLKPSNILVTADGTPKLLDFGIAKLLGSEETEATATQARMFTPEYASPEQLNGLPVTTASDVYSLGVVLYEMLSGHRPFRSTGRSYQDIVNRIMTEEPVRPSSFFGGTQQAIPGDTAPDDQRRTGSGEGNAAAGVRDRRSLEGDLDNIILKALRKEPERRYWSVQEFSDDIRRHLSGMPVTATADTKLYRLSKFVERHRHGVISAGVGLLLLCTVSTIAVWLGIAALREGQKAERRLGELRDVAKSLVNDTNDSLSKIPGNILIRKGLAERSVAMLDSLANDETTDAQLLTELADAYLKLANLQNWSFREFDKALGNIEKAAAIQRRILANDPSNIVLRKQIYTAQMRHIEALHNTNRREEMFQIAAEAIENRRELVRLEPENPSNYANLAALFGWFGDKYLLFGQADEAVNSYREGVGIVEVAIEKQGTQLDSAEARAEFARLHFIKGWLLKGAGEPEKAIEFYARSASIAKEVFNDTPSVSGNLRRVIGGYEEIAWVHEAQGDFQGAFDSYSAGIEFIDQALKQPKVPEYGLLLGYKCNYTVSSGKLASRLSQPAEARRLFAAGESLCRQTLENDADDIGLIVDSQPDFFEIAEYYAAVGEREKSVAGLLQISRKLEIIFEKNPLDLTAATSLASTYEKLGDVTGGNRGFYQKSADFWKKIITENTLVPEEIEQMNRVISKFESSLAREY